MQVGDGGGCLKKFFVFLEEFLQVIGTKGLAIVEALYLVTIVFPQKLKLFFLLHAFGYHSEIKAVGQVNYGKHNFLVVIV